MIITGDIAIPFHGAVAIDNVPQYLKETEWIGNLEGSLVSLSDNERQRLKKLRIVFNDFKAIDNLKFNLPFRAFSLANNHIVDAADIETTLNNLNKMGVIHVGAGKNSEEARSEYVLNDFVFIACGWDLIKCVYAKEYSSGVNPYSTVSLLGNVRELTEKYPSKKIIVFLHWNYELELYPQPMDRDFAHDLIDCGAYAVIGCHAHRVQPIEFYKNRPIVYGLGNFAFLQYYYMGGKLKFPEFSYQEIAFELTNDGSFYIHHFEYTPSKNCISYITSEKIIKSNCEFAHLDSREYSLWFKKNRQQKKALPIFYYKDSCFVHTLKCVYVNLRVKIVDLLVKNQFVFIIIKKIMTKIFR